MKSEEEVKKIFDSRMRIYDTLREASAVEKDGMLIVVKMLCEVEIRLLSEILQIPIPENLATKELKV